LFIIKSVKDLGLITEGFEPEHGFSNRLKHNLVSIIEGALKSRFERIGLL